MFASPNEPKKQLFKKTHQNSEILHKIETKIDFKMVFITKMSFTTALQYCCHYLFVAKSTEIEKAPSIEQSD